MTTKHVTLRLTLEERQGLEAIAKWMGVRTIASIIRILLYRAARDMDMPLTPPIDEEEQGEWNGQ